MKRTTLAFLLVILYIINASFMLLQQKQAWMQLFNGANLAGWNTYLGPELDDAGKKISNEAIGLNRDPKKVFTIVNENGENIIRISGECFGALSTKKEYENYHLQLQFKWGSLTWGSKKNKKKDSGILYHSVGPYGADYGMWMRSQEFQVEEGNCGDYWGVAGGIEDMPASKNAGNQYEYNPTGKLFVFSEKSEAGRHGIKRGDAEKPSGEWNTLDLYCFGDTSIHVINGKTMMVLYHSRQWDNGQELPLTKGSIQIQSEGAEVFYRHIQIRQISGLPAELIN